MRALEYKSELTIESFGALLGHAPEFIQVTVTSPTDAAPRQSLGARRRMGLVQPQLRVFGVPLATRQIGSVTPDLLASCQPEQDEVSTSTQPNAARHDETGIATPQRTPRATR